MSIPANQLAAYEALVATNPAVQRKGAKIPYTSRNGHMFSFLAGDGTLVLRLSEADRAAFLKKHQTTLHTAHGRVMQEFVEVPPRLAANLREVTPYFAASYDYVGSLKPKPTTRKPAAKKKVAKVAKKPVAKRRA